jgi:hypothetical protein
MIIDDKKKSKRAKTLGVGSVDNDGNTSQLSGQYSGIMSHNFYDSYRQRGNVNYEMFSVPQPQKKTNTGGPSTGPLGHGKPQ